MVHTPLKIYETEKTYKSVYMEHWEKNPIIATPNTLYINLNIKKINDVQNKKIICTEPIELEKTAFF